MWSGILILKSAAPASLACEGLLMRLGTLVAIKTILEFHIGKLFEVDHANTLVQS